MKYKLFYFLSLIFSFFCILRGEIQSIQSNNEKITGLYFISSREEYIGQGQTRAYQEGVDGHFSVNSAYGKSLCIRFKGDENICDDYWILDFCPPAGQKLEVGLYKGATHFSFRDKDKPGFCFQGCHRCNNELTATFEILELIYNEEGKVESFAANFIQDGLLFGTVRYNSNIPIDLKIYQIHYPQSNEKIFYLIRCNSNDTVIKKNIIHHTNECDMLIRQPPYGGSGVSIHINPRERREFIVDFSADTEPFKIGLFQDIDRYPFNHNEYGLQVLYNIGGSLFHDQGAFRILSYRSNKKGKIREFAANFKFHDIDGLIYEGAVRYKSTIPINLEHPFDHEETDNNQSGQ